MSSSCPIAPNSDISGIGIRIGIYITSYLIAFVPNLEQSHYGINKLRSALLQAAGLNGFALIITAVVQTAKSQLDLYHAIIIIHQLSFLGLTTIPAGMYKATLERMFVHYFSMWATSALFIAWWLYVWVTAPTFGGNPTTGCNDSIIYVVFFKNVRATAPWLRWLFVAIGSIVAFFLVLIPIVAWPSLRAAASSVPDHPTILEYPRRMAESTTRTPPEDLFADGSTALQRDTNAISQSPRPDLTRGRGARDQDDFWDAVSYRRGGFNSSYRCPDSTRTRIMVDVSTQVPERVQRLDDTLGAATRGSRSLIARLMFVTYGTVMLELTVKRNNIAPGENVWSFGQIVAVAIAVGGINEVVHFFLGKEWRHETAEDEQIEEERSASKVTQKAWKELRKKRRRFAEDLEANRRTTSTSNEDDKVAAPNAENGSRSDIMLTAPARPDDSSDNTT